MTKKNDFQLEPFVIAGEDGPLAKAPRWHARAWARPARSVAERWWLTPLVRAVRHQNP